MISFKIKKKSLLICAILTGLFAALLFATTVYFKKHQESKLKFYKKIYTTYINTCKSKLWSRFSNADLQFAIANARQQSWVQQQITADLSPFSRGISKQELENLFIKFQDQFNGLMKIKIANGDAEFTAPIELQNRLAYKTMVEVANILAKKRLVPDCEFIVALNDYLAIVPIGHTAAVPIFTFAKHLEIPVEKDLILVPDWMNLRYWDLLRDRIKLASKVYAWHDKKEIIHWRGGSSADSMQHRIKLVTLSTYNRYIDAGMIDGDFKVSRVDPEFSLKYKYQISLDGARSTWERVVWQMHSNSVMLKPQSAQVQWFYKGLVPFVNYVPLKDIDEENVSATYKWLQENDSLVYEITSNANKFAAENLKTQDFIAYYVVLLHEYAKLLH